MIVDVFGEVWTGAFGDVWLTSEAADGALSVDRIKTGGLSTDRVRAGMLSVAGITSVTGGLSVSRVTLGDRRTTP